MESIRSHVPRCVFQWNTQRDMKQRTKSTTENSLKRRSSASSVSHGPLHDGSWDIDRLFVQLYPANFVRHIPRVHKTRTSYTIQNVHVVMVAARKQTSNRLMTGGRNSIPYHSRNSLPRHSTACQTSGSSNRPIRFRTPENKNKRPRGYKKGLQQTHASL